MRYQIVSLKYIKGKGKSYGTIFGETSALTGSLVASALETGQLKEGPQSIK